MLQAPASRVAAATRRLCFATIFLTNAASAATRQNEMSKVAPGAERWPGFLLRRAVARAAEISWALQASADRLFLLLEAMPPAGGFFFATMTRERCCDQDRRI